MSRRLWVRKTDCRAKPSPNPLPKVMTYLKNQPGSQPEGLPESSRGSKRSADPRNRSINDSHPEGAPDRLCDPFRVKIQLRSDPGVSLRSTPGYYLAALRAAWVLSRNVIT